MGVLSFARLIKPSLQILLLQSKVSLSSFVIIIIIAFACLRQQDILKNE